MAVVVRSVIVQVCVAVRMLVRMWVRVVMLVLMAWLGATDATFALVHASDRKHTHLCFEHPASDSDDENPGSNREVRLDSLRDQPRGTCYGQTCDQDNAAGVCQRNEDSEDKCVYWATAHTDNIRCGDRLSVPRCRGVDRPQPEAGQQKEDCLSHLAGFQLSREASSRWTEG
jgi:hypothetical protein